MEKSDFVEGHIGVILGLITVLFDDKICPDLLAEKDDNLVGNYFRVRSNGKFEFESDNFTMTENLFYNFDPKKIICSKQLQQVQFMCRLISQCRFLMDLAEFKVI